MLPLSTGAAGLSSINTGVSTTSFKLVAVTTSSAVETVAISSLGNVAEAVAPSSPPSYGISWLNASKSNI